MRRSALLASFAVPLGLCIAAVSALAQPIGGSDPIPDVAVARLPLQARETLALIRSGGPFPYERDGVRFGNRERLLPQSPRDYYREYTVSTPGVRTRGARRVVCGGPAREPHVCYYTDDHYRSFRRIRE